MKTYTITQIKDALAEIKNENDPVILQLQSDSRKGVQTLLNRWKSEKEKEREELERYRRMLVHENRLRRQGFEWICGIDEAGRGPLAGPVVAAAVILTEEAEIPGLDDSKKLSEAKRLQLFDRIHEDAKAIGVGIISAEDIDKYNIYEAVKKAMKQAVSELAFQPDFLLVDAMRINAPYPQESIIKGDANSISIAAASIIAKVTRDRLMVEYDQKYPEYGFAIHKGYGTKSHLDALKKCGPCPIHRQSFAPVQAARK
ncbi:ribonuclease HII [Siminovitchia acidinfaciens]|uniref:Ribonuclease HII n=1 Tax=Siminovitchia acidinfaciens TaxID=2321395 RepID=A0A429Y2J1_9BACI|nr:ribonuclease HII [Siminovitchia acidinfaciens]RST75471.1 ribonuclease HII [Siminovitchia acidinfaciens]